jgi:hypothetical protein
MSYGILRLGNALGGAGNMSVPERLDNPIKEYQSDRVYCDLSLKQFRGNLRCYLLGWNGNDRPP